MGGGLYSESRAGTTATTFSKKSQSEIFTERNINNAMDPHGVTMRESRDSDEHPNSLAILLGIDVTGSMGIIPEYLVKQGLANLMSNIIKGGNSDPQMMLMGIGDTEYDESPLQIGQFESSDELMNHWLTKLYLEGGGGPNFGESYLLAWMFAAMHTSIDCYEKRQIKGYLFTIGDEPTLIDVPKNILKKIMGASTGQYNDFTASQLLEMARKTYNVYHVHVKETRSGSRQAVINNWIRLIGESNLIIVNRKEDIADAIAKTINSNPSIDQINSNNIGDNSNKVKDEEVHLR